MADFIHVDAARNIIYDARTKNRTPIAVVGLRDSILVQTDDAVLLARKIAGAEDQGTGPEARRGREVEKTGVAAGSATGQRGKKLIIFSRLIRRRTVGPPGASFCLGTLVCCLINLPTLPGTNPRKPRTNAKWACQNSQSPDNFRAAMRKPATKFKPAPKGNAPPVKSGPRSPAWLLAGLLALVTILAYQPVWRAGFIWDDDEYVTDNPLLTAPDGLWRIWFSFDSPSQYFPLAYTVFRLERWLWGLNPAGYHWVNLLLHVANALLVWRLLWRLGVPGAWLAAAIFALHPVQVETVAWITELKNVLMLFCLLLALLAWVEFIDGKIGLKWRFYALALVGYALALCAKTTACTLPAALLLILWLKAQPITWRRLAAVTPFVALGVGMGLLTMWWERYHQGTEGKVFALGLMERMLVASRAVWFYAGKLLWPVNLTFSYPRWTISAANPGGYGWLLATAGVAVVIWRVRRLAGRGVEVALLFFVMTLAPVLGFIMLYTFLYSFVADHYQYVACLGPVALVSAGLAHWAWGWQRRKPWLEGLVCAALILGLGTLTWRQARMYQNAETLWQATLRRNPDSWLAHNNLGDAFSAKGPDRRGDQPIPGSHPPQTG